MAKKERLIELLQEKRDALITQAVTKGLEPKRTMKHTGVEWLEEFQRIGILRSIKWAANGKWPYSQDVSSYWRRRIDIPYHPIKDKTDLNLRLYVGVVDYKEQGFRYITPNLQSDLLH